jgi:hypothetical protein
VMFEEFVMLKVRTNCCPVTTGSVFGLQPVSFGPTTTDETDSTVAVIVFEVTVTDEPFWSV